MYGRNSRLTHPTEYSLPAKLKGGTWKKSGGKSLEVSYNEGYRTFSCYEAPGQEMW